MGAVFSFSHKRDLAIQLVLGHADAFSNDEREAIVIQMTRGDRRGRLVWNVVQRALAPSSMNVSTGIS